jgi:hypothetical protein
VKIQFLMRQEGAVHDHEIDETTWNRIREILKSKKEPTPPVGSVVSEAQARRIGQVINDYFSLEAGPPEPPSYIVPLATSNGVWVDPALAPLNHWRQQRTERMEELIAFSVICRYSKGFSVGQ